MVIRRIGLPSILKDNEMQYMAHLLRLIESQDKDASVMIYKSEVYSFSIQTSENIKEDIQAMHDAWGIKIRFIKSRRFLKFFLV